MLHGFDRSQRKARTAEILRQVGLDESTFGCYPLDLTASEQQRVGIARALVTRPELVGTDEPTSMLDPSARADLLALLQRIQRETGTAYVFISHDLTSVARISHRIAIMYLGHIVEQAPTEMIMGQQHHPISRALLICSFVSPIHCGAFALCDRRRNSYRDQSESGMSALWPLPDSPECLPRSHSSDDRNQARALVGVPPVEPCRRCLMPPRAERCAACASPTRCACPSYIGRRVLFLVPTGLFDLVHHLRAGASSPRRSGALSSSAAGTRRGCRGAAAQTASRSVDPQQYIIWLKRALSGDFGTSWSQGTESAKISSTEFR